MEQRFNEVYTKTYNYVYLRAKSILKREDDVQQLMRDVYLKMLETPDVMVPECMYEWLGRQVYAMGFMQYRKKKEREAEWLELSEEELRAPKGVDVENTIAVIDNHLDDLPDLYHATLYAFYYDFLPVADMAELMGCSVGVVLNRLNYARKYMHKALENYHDETKVNAAFSAEMMRSALRTWSVAHCMGMTVAQAVYSEICKAANMQASAISVEGKEFGGVNHTVIYYQSGDFGPIADEMALYKEKKRADKKVVFGIIGTVAAVAVVVACVIFVISALDKKSDEPKPAPVETEQSEENAPADVPAEEPAEEPITDVPETPEEEPTTEEPVVEEPVVEEPKDSTYILPDSDSRKLKKSDLQGLNKKQLRLARNELFARHGVVFDVADLDNYFATKSWYEPKITLEDFEAQGGLSAIEEANVVLISKREEQLNQ